MARTANMDAIRNSKRDLQNAIREAQLNCDHKNAKGPVLDSVADSNEYIKGKNNYSEFAVICKQCKDIFDMQSFTQLEIRDALNVLYSMCNQIKVLDNPSDNDYEKIKSIMEFLDEIQSSFVGYYLEMIKKLGSGQRKNGNGGRQKGKLGINQGQFASR